MRELLKKFLTDDFLLKSDIAKKLYHSYASKMPIIDYHCHVSPKEIYEDKCFENISQVWLSGDHYKWRLMRSNGVPEEYITGSASDRDKFQKFAELLPKAIGNPMYHWCHLELKNYFGYEGVLNGDTAEEAKNDLLVAYEEIKELNKEEGKKTPVLEFSFKYDIASFFDYYKMLNVTEVARRVGINPSLMRRYRSGISHASQKQYDKLRDYIHRLGAELSAAQF